MVESLTPIMIEISNQCTVILVVRYPSLGSNMKFYLTIDELYDVIEEAHLKTEQKGRSVRMHDKKNAIQMFLNLFHTCLKEKKTERRGYSGNSVPPTE